MYYKITALFLIPLMLLSNTAFSDKVIDITGVYQSEDGSSNYLTINRKGDDYVLINITKDIEFLKRLSLVDEVEVDNISPSIEEFAFSFFYGDFILKENEEIMSLSIPLNLVVAFPERTTQIENLRGYIWIVLNAKDSNTITLDFFISSSIFLPTENKYKKIF